MKTHSINMLWKINILSAVLGCAAAQGGTGYITPYVGQEGNWDCHPVTLDQGNVIGFFSMPRDRQTVDAEVLFKAGPGKGKLRLRMMKQDAESLRSEIRALLAKSRPRPIRFAAKSDGNGECEVVQITG